MQRGLENVPIEWNEDVAILGVADQPAPLAFDHPYPASPAYSYGSKAPSPPYDRNFVLCIQPINPIM